MSHSCLILCLSGSVTPDKIEEAIAAALAPFDENMRVEPYRRYEEGDAKDHWNVNKMREEAKWDGVSPLSWEAVVNDYNERYAQDDDKMFFDPETGRAFELSTYNPKSRWDWYSIGGRYSDRFIRKAGAPDDETLSGRRSWTNRHEPSDANKCDGGRKRSLDIEGSRQRRANDDCAQWDRFHALTAGLPEAQTWDSFRARVHAGELIIEDARIQYHAQPRVEAANKDEEFRGWWGDCVIKHFSRTREQVAEESRQWAVAGWALLDLTGNWNERGKMGWFGMSDSTDESEATYRKAASDYIDSLHEDTWVIAVDCHI